MEKEKRISGSQERSFECTKQFVRVVYDEAFLGEICLDQSQIDIDKPYTQIYDKFYQEDFATTFVRKGEEIPLLMMPIDSRPDPSTPAVKRRSNVSLLYIFADDKNPDETYQTGENIGKLYGVSKEMIRKDVSNHLKNLHNYALNNTRATYPFSTLETRRPYTIAMKLDSSLGHGVSALEIEEMVKKGHGSDQIIKEYGSLKVGSARIQLEKWGMVAPERIRRDIYKISAEINDPVTTNERLCELIQEFNDNGILRRYGKGQDALLLTVSALQYEAWGNRDKRQTKKAFQLLEKAGVPVTTFVSSFSHKRGGMFESRYYITLARTKEQALEVLRDASAENYHQPVVQVAGDTLENIPTTHKLFGLQKGEYVLIGIKDVGGSIKKLAKLKQLIRGESSCPIPVVEYNSLERNQPLYIRKSDKEIFDDWLASQEFDE